MHFKNIKIYHKDVPINQQLNNALWARVEENRKILRVLVNVVLLFAKQNIVYRGHHEDSKYVDDPNYNSGNYQEFLRFIAEKGNGVLRLHFENAARNATYRSKNIQNELSNISAELLRNEIVKEITRATFFSIMADEAADVSVLRNNYPL